MASLQSPSIVRDNGTTIPYNGSYSPNIPSNLCISLKEYIFKVNSQTFNRQSQANVVLN